MSIRALFGKVIIVTLSSTSNLNPVRLMTFSKLSLLWIFKRQKRLICLLNLNKALLVNRNFGPPGLWIFSSECPYLITKRKVK